MVGYDGKPGFPERLAERFGKPGFVMGPLGEGNRFKILCHTEYLAQKREQVNGEMRDFAGDTPENYVRRSGLCLAEFAKFMR